MPWQEHGSGYTTKRGGHVRNVPQYEALRDKGMSKDRAAAITNAHKRKRGPKKDDDNGASTVLVKAAPRWLTVGEARAAAHEFGTGARQGKKLANEGHSLIGPFGSGHAGRKTYTVKNASPARRAGIHAGVVGAKTPALVPVAAGGAVIEHHRMSKAIDRRDAASAFLGGGAVGSATSAHSQHRRARLKRAESAEHASTARGVMRTAEARMLRHGMTPGTKGALARDSVSIRNTGNLLHIARVQEHQASATAREGLRAGRSAKGRAGVAVGLAGGAAVLARRRDRPHYASVGYR